jgi:hypothetical protein
MDIEGAAANERPFSTVKARRDKDGFADSSAQGAQKRAGYWVGGVDRPIVLGDPDRGTGMTMPSPVAQVAELTKHFRRPRVVTVRTRVRFRREKIPGSST